MSLKLRPRLLTQKRVPGRRRTTLGYGMTQAIERAIKREQALYPGISRQLVIQHALAFTFGIDITDEDYK